MIRPQKARLNVTRQCIYNQFVEAVNGLEISGKAAKTLIYSDILERLPFPFLHSRSFIFSKALSCYW